MNARQRRYVVASLKSVSVLFATTYFAIVTFAWYFGDTRLDIRPLLSPLALAALFLATGGALWLAHFVTLGNEVRVWSLDASSRPSAESTESDCPGWPTILAWLVTDLEGDEAHRISAHVSACAQCRRRLALMTAVQEMSSDKGR